MFAVECLLCVLFGVYVLLFDCGARCLVFIVVGLLCVVACCVLCIV